MAEITRGRKAKPFVPGAGDDKFRAASMRQEDELAQRLGGQRVLGSGALSGLPGDVDLGEFLLEAKLAVNAQSVGVSVRKLGKIWEEATSQGKLPAFVLGFRKMPPPTPASWVCVPEDVFAEMLAAYRQVLKERGIK